MTKNVYCVRTMRTVVEETRCDELRKVLVMTRREPGTSFSGGQSSRVQRGEHRCPRSPVEPSGDAACSSAAVSKEWSGRNDDAV